MAWYLTQLTPEAAEKHDRMVHKAQPPVMLGWKPYTYCATRSAVAQFACHEDWQLDAALRHRGLKVKGWAEWRDGVRTTELVERGESV